MNRNTSINIARYTFALAALSLLILPVTSQATSGIKDDWIAYYDPCPELVAANCNACHQNGFDYNVYGEDMRFRTDDLGMSNEEAFVDIEGLDSDGDGYTNGQEIVVDCTLPWDDGSMGTVAAEAARWAQVKALYR